LVLTGELPERRVSAGLRAQVDPEKAPKLRFAAESGKSYPVAILVVHPGACRKKAGLPERRLAQQPNDA
jgi:hypothetical protein